MIGTQFCTDESARLRLTFPPRSSWIWLAAPDEHEEAIADCSRSNRQLLRTPGEKECRRTIITSRAATRVVQNLFPKLRHKGSSRCSGLTEKLTISHRPFGVNTSPGSREGVFLASSCETKERVEGETFTVDESIVFSGSSSFAVGIRAWVTLRWSEWEENKGEIGLEFRKNLPKSGGGQLLLLHSWYAQPNSQLISNTHTLPSAHLHPSPPFHRFKRSRNGHPWRNRSPNWFLQRERLSSFEGSTGLVGKVSSATCFLPEYSESELTLWNR